MYHNAMQLRTLLSINAFHDEAISYIVERPVQRVRFLPLLATLANYSAKTFSPEWYDLKDSLLNAIENVRYAEGYLESGAVKWRTWEGFDPMTEAYPYVFYIETSYTPQLSFHCAELRRTNREKGRWSGVVVQDIAPKLIKNLLKKDGFSGRVWDMRTITVNTMLGNGIEEAAHLWKGKNYTFEVTGNGSLYVVREGTPLFGELDDRLVQSFLTRLCKEQAQPETGSGDADEKEAGEAESAERSGTNSTQDGNPGDEADCAEPADAEQPTEYATPTEQEGGSSSGNWQADKPESAHGGGGAGETDNPSETEPAELSHATEGASGLCEPGTDNQSAHGQQAGNCKREDSRELATAIEQGNTQGFYDLLPFSSSSSKNEEHEGRGGAQLNTSKSGKPNLLVQEALMRLASGHSLSRKDEGLEKWDAKKFVKAVAINPAKLPTAKFSRPSEKLIFSVDTSGSVEPFGRFILEMLASAKNVGSFSVWSGSEAFPETCHTSQERISYAHIGPMLTELLNIEQPAFGSSIVFWGDGCMVFTEKDQAIFRKAVMQYQIYWLAAPDSSSYTMGRLAKSGVNIIHNVGCARSFTKALNKLC